MNAELQRGLESILSYLFGFSFTCSFLGTFSRMQQKTQDTATREVDFVSELDSMGFVVTDDLCFCAFLVLMLSVTLKQAPLVPNSSNRVSLIFR